MKASRTLPLLLLLAAVAGTTGCIGVRVERHVGNVSARFDRALDRIHDLEREGRGLRPHRLVILASGDGGHEVVRVTVPLWMAEMALEAGLEADFDERSRRARDRYDIDWRSLRDLDELGPGLLVQVDDRDERVLIWLE